MKNFEQFLTRFLFEKRNEDPTGMAYKAGAGQDSEWGPPTKFGDTATRGSMGQGAKASRKIIRQRSDTGQRLEPNRRQKKHLQYAVHKGWSGAAQTSPDQTPEQKARRAKLIQPTEKAFTTNLPKSERDKDNPFRDLAIKTVLGHERRRRKLKEGQREFDFEEKDEYKETEAQRKAREAQRRRDDIEQARQLDSLEDYKIKKYKKKGNWRRGR